MSRRHDPQGDRFFALRTFRRDGSTAQTPIWLAPANGRWYGFTPARSWKVRRIRRNPVVEVAPSDFDGNPSGPWRRGRARILPPSERSSATSALTIKYGNRFRLFRIITRLGMPREHGGAGVGIELTIDGATGDGA